MSTTLPASLLKSAIAGEPFASAGELMQAVRQLLASQKTSAARLAAARGAMRFPDDPSLTQANRVLNPTRITPRPASGVDRSREFAWLEQHAGDHRGRWVALVGDELIASSDELSKVLDAIRARKLAVKPLVHNIE